MTVEKKIIKIGSVVENGYVSVQIDHVINENDNYTKNDN